jgi:single-strand DNA-binding protein
MNRIVLVGRLTKDPEVRVIEEKGKTVTRFTLAVDRGFKNSSGEREADFIPVVLWGRKAEVAGQYITKGSMVSICGRLQTKSYEDSEGKRKFVSEVVADEVRFVDTRKTGEAI